MRIKVTKNGPYVVTGAIPIRKQAIATDDDGYSLEWQADVEVPSQETYALCRCGRSNAMPFCDGTHKQVSFDGSETASRTCYLDQARKITGPALDLTDARAFCAGARFCDRAGGIRNLIKKSDSLEARRLAVEEAYNCPSGRLVVWDKNGKAMEPKFEPSIVLVEDPHLGVSGPLWVRGGVPIESSDGALYEIRNRVTLCRCGKSANKPFCDGSHMEK